MSPPKDQTSVNNFFYCLYFKIHFISVFRIFIICVINCFFFYFNCVVNYFCFNYIIMWYKKKYLILVEDLLLTCKWNFLNLFDHFIFDNSKYDLIRFILLKHYFKSYLVNFSKGWYFSHHQGSYHFFFGSSFFMGFPVKNDLFWP